MHTLRTAQLRPAEPARRIPIHQDESVRWDLVSEDAGWMVERVADAAHQRFSVEAFESSEEGCRLANALTVALARTPGA